MYEVSLATHSFMLLLEGHGEKQVRNETLKLKLNLNLKRKVMLKFTREGVRSHEDVSSCCCDSVDALICIRMCMYACNYVCNMWLYLCENACVLQEQNKVSTFRWEKTQME